jgi:hypothetical protein
MSKEILSLFFMMEKFVLNEAHEKDGNEVLEIKSGRTYLNTKKEVNIYH